MPSTTNNMSLKIPNAGETDYASSVSDSFIAVDNHDHSSGKGTQVVSSGIADSAITTQKLADLNVTTSKLAAGVLSADSTGRGKVADGFLTKVKQAAMASGTTAAAGDLAISSSSGAFSGNSGIAADVTNLSVTITTTGRPVWIGLIHDGSTAPGEDGYVSVTDSASAVVEAVIYLRRDSTDISVQRMLYEDAASALKLLQLPLSSVNAIDTPAGGTYTYKARYQLVSGDLVEVNHAKLVAYEL